MNEAEWLASTDSVRLLEYLDRPQGDRKLFLFAIACCQAIRPLIPQPEMRAGLKTAEQYADGTATSEQLDAADWRVEGALYGGVEYYENRPELELPPEIADWLATAQMIPADQLVAMACCGGEELPPNHMRLFVEAGYFVDHVLIMNSCVPHSPTLRWYRRFLNASLVREVFGDPFRPLPPRPEAMAPLAEQIYAGAWEKTPLLGEWLQEHGYPTEAEHCLDPNIHHVKGCWVVDWVTGRQ
jgi:hypothetical protein